MIYITGDKHGNFAEVKRFCKANNTSTRDILIVLGDAGINFSGGIIDAMKKVKLARLPITLFCIHGNHDMRPSKAKVFDFEHLRELDRKAYRLIPWHGGKVYKEYGYPNILFARDGEVFDFNGISALVCGGAYSPDKPARLANGWTWYADEQPDTRIKHRVERKIDEISGKVDVVLTHTIPAKYLPLLRLSPWPGIDLSTERWLDTVEDRLSYQKWYAGHYHMDRNFGRLQIMMHDIRPLTVDRK